MWLCHQAVENSLRVLVLEIEGETALAPIEGLEEQAVRPLLSGRHIATDVSSHRRILDLDDLGPHVGQKERPERSRPILLDRDDAHATQRGIVYRRQRVMPRRCAQPRTAPSPGGAGRWART